MASTDPAQEVRRSGGYDEYPFVAEFYDHIVPYQEREDVGFWVEMARDSGGPVLELGCGTGRVLIPTARAGIRITGIDLSSSMLAVCRQKLADESDEVRARAELAQVDMRDFRLEGKFHLATTPFRPFQHLITVEDQLSCLRSVHRHLVDEGRFVLDLFNPSLERLTDNRFLEESGEEPAFEMPDGRRVLRRERVLSRDLANQFQEVELIYYVTHPDGREERLVHGFPMRYLFRYEAEHLLSLAGFQVEEVYSDYDRSPFGYRYPGELILVARKP